MRWLAAIALLLLPFVAPAADGDSWSAFTDTVRGQYTVVGVVLCDGKVAADSVCAEFDLAADPASRGIPEFYTIVVDTIDAQCSGTPDFQLRGRMYSAGPTSDIASFTGVGTSEAIYPEHPIIDMALSDDGGCDAPGNTVGLVLFYPR